MLIGGVVHRHNQVPVPSRHPQVRRTILMQHHARQRAALPVLSVFAFGRCPLHHAGCLQLVFHPGIAARTAIPPVPGMEMPGVPALVAATVGLHQPHHLIHRCSPVRHLFQSLVDQAFQARPLLRATTPDSLVARNI